MKEVILTMGTYEGGYQKEQLIQEKLTMEQLIKIYEVIGYEDWEIEMKVEEYNLEEKVVSQC